MGGPACCRHSKALWSEVAPTPSLSLAAPCMVLQSWATGPGLHMTGWGPFSWGCTGF